MDDKLIIRHFESEEKLIHYCNVMYRWQVLSISLENGIYTLFGWIGDE